MIDQRIGPYRVQSLVGDGGMGKVYRALAEEDAVGVAAGTCVALKVLHTFLAQDPAYVRRFAREASVGMRIRQPHLVPVLGFGRAEVRGRTRMYLVMEFVEGDTFRAVLERDGPMDESRLRAFGSQIASALEAVHAEGIVHRDVKPENLILEDANRVRLMDLGLARPAAGDDQVSLAGEFLGSLAYASPEQIRGGELGPATDLYSLGITLYELASRQQPFESVNSQAVVSAQLTLVPPELQAIVPGISPSFSATVETLLQKDPAKRFPSARALADVLREGEASTWWKERNRR